MKEHKDKTLLEITEVGRVLMRLKSIRDDQAYGSESRGIFNKACDSLDKLHCHLVNEYIFEQQQKQVKS